MEILIISGFLGAGKTRFIQEMAKATQRQYVIVENEFADIGIDGKILKSQDGGNSPAALELTEISEGCICCSSNLDFSDTILTIANTLDPDYLLVEPSGVAILSNILRTLETKVYEKIQILDPITIVDALHYQSSKIKYPQYFKDQLSSAKHIILSKSENLSQVDFETIKESLKIKPSQNFPTRHYGKFTKDEWYSLFSKKSKPAFKRKVQVSTNIENIAFVPFKCPNLDHLVYILQDLMTGKHGYIYRAKGFFEAGNYWYRFDYVDGQYLIGQSPDMEESRAVVIGTDLKRKNLEKLFI